MPKINSQKEALRIIGKIYKNVQNKNWTCMCSSCANVAINSHLLMRNGILNYVAEEGHLYELHSVPPQAFKKEEIPVDFKKVGINQAISFPLFCNEHDTTIFKAIEDGSEDYTLYKHLALYSYRALVAELRKKEIEAEKQKRIINSITLRKFFARNVFDNFKKSREQELRGIADLEYYRVQIIKDINEATESFAFFTREIPLKGIYASTISSIFATMEETISSPLLNTFFFHLIPQEDSSIIVIGYHKEHHNAKIAKYAERWMNVPIEEIGVMLTALFAQIETWGMSPTLYNQLNPEKIKLYFNKLRCSFETIDQTPIENINLFEGII